MLDGMVLVREWLVERRDLLGIRALGMVVMTPSYSGVGFALGPRVEVYCSIEVEEPCVVEVTVMRATDQWLWSYDLRDPRVWDQLEELIRFWRYRQ